jgi:hypothetical protein
MKAAHDDLRCQSRAGPAPAGHGERAGRPARIAVVRPEVGADPAEEAGGDVRIEIFPTRIEVTSPGRFPGIVDIALPQSITRHVRNPHIARVCADLRIGQEPGEGIRRMMDTMAAAGLAGPSFRQTASHVIVTLSAHGLLDEETVARLPSGAPHRAGDPPARPRRPPAPRAPPLRCTYTPRGR